MKKIRKRLVFPAFLLGGVLVGVFGIVHLDHKFPPPLPVQLQKSDEILDRKGALLRAFTTPDGFWRLTAELEDIDAKFLSMLIAYEDQRFWSHGGVDGMALIRAAGQWFAAGQIVSGGSTITMQLARLLEPRKGRSIKAKLFQILRAWQIEHRFDKRAILEMYLTLAPYGGNLEGVRAASLAYFGRGVTHLGLAQSALLVALPQLPEYRRPDRFPAQARLARDRVLYRLARAGKLEPREAHRASSEPVPQRRLEMPSLAAHMADRLRAGDGAKGVYSTTLDRNIQAALEGAARDAAERIDDRVSVAMMLVDATTGNVLGHVGSADYFDTMRSGSIDMTGKARSPGSTLKPFIYALAIEEGLVTPETLIDDSPANFSGYLPKNFDRSHQGEVTIRQSLQMSLNVPAVRLLESVGPGRLLGRLERAGVATHLPRGVEAGLALGLGGVGLSLHDLVQLYTSLVNLGPASGLRELPEERLIVMDQIVTPSAAWQIGEILQHSVHPANAGPIRIAYKTGTSYGYRDAWAVGYTGKHVLGVWIGRPDNGPVPQMTGYTAAAPALFDALVRTRLAIEPYAAAPAGLHLADFEELHPSLRRFTPSAELPVLVGGDSAPEITYPPAGARIELGSDQGVFTTPLVIKLQGGRAPFRWLANGSPLPIVRRRRSAEWMPDSTGYSKLTVIDASGRSDSVQIYVE